jgi:hypothetical protein
MARKYVDVRPGRIYGQAYYGHTFVAISPRFAGVGPKSPTRDAARKRINLLAAAARHSLRGLRPFSQQSANPDLFTEAPPTAADPRREGSLR